MLHLSFSSLEVGMRVIQYPRRTKRLGVTGWFPDKIHTSDGYLRNRTTHRGSKDVKALMLVTCDISLQSPSINHLSESIIISTLPSSSGHCNSRVDLILRLPCRPKTRPSARRSAISEGWLHVQSGCLFKIENADELMYLDVFRGCPFFVNR